MVFIITTVALGRRMAAAEAVAACAHSLSYSHRAARVAHMCGGGGSPYKARRAASTAPLGWLASFIINAMRAGDLDFEKLSSNTGVA